MIAMNTIEPDDRGLVRVCPQCGQRNRLIYERLGSIFRCSKCRTEYPRRPSRLKCRTWRSSTRSSLGPHCPCSWIFGTVVWSL